MKRVIFLLFVCVAILTQASSYAQTVDAKKKTESATEKATKEKEKADSKAA